MDLFGQSVQAAAMGQPIPEDGYKGEYIADLAKSVLAQNPAITALADDARLIAFRETAYQLQLKDQQRVLEELRSSLPSIEEIEAELANDLPPV